MKSHKNSTSQTIEELNQAIDITELGIWEWSLEEDSVFLSDGVFKIIGVKPKDFDHTMTYIVAKVIHPESRMDFMKAMAQLRREGSTNNDVYRVSHPNKAACWVKCFSQIILDDRQRAIKILGTLLEVTEEYVSKRKMEKELSFFKSIFQTISSPIAYKSPEGEYQYCNDAFLQFLGKDRSEVIGQTMDVILPSETFETFRIADEELLLSRQVQNYEEKIPHADGTLHTVLLSRAVHVNQKKQNQGIVSVMQDVTNQKFIEREVNMLYKAKDVFLAINRDIMVYKNYEEFFGDLQFKLQKIFEYAVRSTVLEYNDDCTLSILINRGYDKIASKRFRVPVEKSFVWRHLGGLPQRAIIINDVEHKVDEDYKLLQPEYGSVSQSVLMIPLYLDGEFKWLLSFESEDNYVFDEIDELVAEYICEELPIVIRMFEMYQKTLMLSRYDGLTGLMNRRYFENVFEEKISRAFYNKGQLLVVLFDLDGLKKVNDTYGHQAGDTYIKEFVMTLTESFEEPDVLARIGGDEFTAVFENMDMALLIHKIEAIRQAFGERLLQSGQDTFKGGFSYGLSIYPDHSEHMYELQKIADEKMYIDKQNRKRKLK